MVLRVTCSADAWWELYVDSDLEAGVRVQEVLMLVRVFTFFCLGVLLDLRIFMPGHCLGFMLAVHFDGDCRPNGLGASSTLA